MTKSTIINICTSHAEPYQVVVGQEILGSIPSFFDFSKYSSLFLLTEENVWQHIEGLIEKSLVRQAKVIKIQSGEENKTIQQVQYVWQELQSGGADRKSLLINVGGGVIGDLGGFAASSYMRGIDFIQIPTTLLSQVDASVGGKTGVNFSGVKNLIGAFYQPKIVIIDTDTLKTLPEREIASGMAENIKHALIQDAEFLNYLERLSQPNWAEIIARSVKIKAEIVEADEKEAGLRKLLNFGHTAGHAFESLLLGSSQHLLHGEAVALGMLYEAYLSENLEEEDFQKIKAMLRKYNLPVKLTTSLDYDTFCQKLKTDKKNVADKINWTLLEKIGEGVFDREVSLEQYLLAFNKITEN